MSILSAWRTSLALFQPREMKAFLREVAYVGWSCYKTTFIYFWWVTLLLIAYVWRWHLVLFSQPSYQIFVSRVLSEFVNVFESGFFFLLVSYAWVITTRRVLPRVVDYFIRLLYFYIPYVFLQEGALFVQEHMLSLGVFISMYSFIGLNFYAFFLLDIQDGMKVPFYSAARALQLFWYNAPFLLVVGLIGSGIEVAILSLLRSTMPQWQHDFIQRELFYITLPLLISFFAVIYAKQAPHFLHLRTEK